MHEQTHVSFRKYKEILVFYLYIFVSCLSFFFLFCNTHALTTPAMERSVLWAVIRSWLSFACFLFEMH